MKRLITILLLMSSCVTEKEKNKDRYFYISDYNFDLAMEADRKADAQTNIDSYYYYRAQFNDYAYRSAVYTDSFIRLSK